MDFADKVIAELIGNEVELFHAYARMVSETDAEALHDFRIGIRRLRSMLNPLGLDDVSARLARAAADVGRLTTPIRDLEVMATELERHGLFEPALSRRMKVSEWYRSSDAHPVIAEVFVELGKWPGAFREALSWMQINHLKKRTTKRMVRQLRRLSLALNDPGHDRHEIRLLAKRVRYSLEAYPALFPLPASLYLGVRQLQSLLGDWHDHHQWCLNAQVEPELQTLVEVWTAAEDESLQKAELLIAPLGVELSEFLAKKNAA